MFPKVIGVLPLGFALAASAASATTGLRLTPPLRQDNGRWQWHVASVDASPLTLDRSERIEIVSSPRLDQPLASWELFAATRALTNGALRVEHPAVVSPGRQFFVARESIRETTVTVRTAAEFRGAVAAATAGTRILLASGTYPGGFSFGSLRGAAGSPIVIAAADPEHPPLIQGGANGIQLSDPEFVELQDLTFAGATGNGLNIDDGGTSATPAHGLVLRRIRVQDVGPTGNHDGIKLSGVNAFRVESCVVERWGTGGSAIDMVGCHQGLIVSNLFRHLPSTAAEVGSGVQAKGGSRDIVIRRNRFEHAGSRAVNLGGSTGREFFRPPLVAGEDHWEARDLTVEGNTFVGSLSPVAFVGVDTAVVRFNTFYLPQRWLMRILQETTAADFVPCRGGSFTDNLVAFDSRQWSAGGVNVGPGTEAATFRFARNWWYCLDTPARSRPTLPVAETGGTYGVSPEFRQVEQGDFRLAPGSPASGVGAEALPLP